MFTVLVCVCIAPLSPPICFHSSPLSQTRNDSNSIWALKHLSPPYLWIMGRFSGVLKFMESTPLRFPPSLHSPVSHVSSSAYLSHVHESRHASTCGPSPPRLRHTRGILEVVFHQCPPPSALPPGLPLPPSLPSLLFLSFALFPTSWAWHDPSLPWVLLR